MNVQKIREKARYFGIKTSRIKKVELIKHIQLAKGNFACFGSAFNGFCDQPSCVWRGDCLGAASKK